MERPGHQQEGGEVLAEGQLHPVSEGRIVHEGELWCGRDHLGHQHGRREPVAMGPDGGRGHRVAGSGLHREPLEHQLCVGRHRLIDRAPAVDHHDGHVLGAKGDPPEDVEHPPGIGPQPQHRCRTHGVVVDRKHVTVQVRRVEAGELVAQAEQGPQREAVIQHHRPGRRLDEVVADDDRSGTAVDHALEGQGQEVLLALVSLEVVPHPDPLPPTVHEEFQLATPHEGQRRPPVQLGAPGLRHVEARPHVARGMREPDRNPTDFVYHGLETEEVDDHEVVDGDAEVPSHRLDERRSAELHAADKECRGQLLLTDRDALPVDHHVEVPGQRNQRCGAQVGIQSQQHDGVGQGDPRGAITSTGGIVLVEAHRTVGADQQDVPGRGRAVLGRCIGLRVIGGATVPIDAVGTDGHVEVSQNAGWHVDPDDAAHRLLEGVQAGGPEEQPGGQEDVGADQQALGPRPPIGDRSSPGVLCSMGGRRLDGIGPIDGSGRHVVQATSGPLTHPGAPPPTAPLTDPPGSRATPARGNRALACPDGRSDRDAPLGPHDHRQLGRRGAGGPR